MRVPDDRKSVSVSIHAPHTGSDDTQCSHRVTLCFNPRSPHGERRFPSVPHALNLVSGHVSIHAPHTGSDVVQLWPVSPVNMFQSTLPTRGATRAAFVHDADSAVSIHAPHTGSDIGEYRLPVPYAVSIHAPHTGSDAIDVIATTNSIVFQSTLPTRGATRPAGLVLRPERFQSTLPTRGATWSASDARCNVAATLFQSTLPTRGATRTGASVLNPPAMFQSTLPTRGATCGLQLGRENRQRRFNPRSPHGERPNCDWAFAAKPPFSFNPRSPHGERLCAKARFIV
jgi:hypothetical protein